MESRDDFFEVIKTNIDRSGYHVTTVIDGVEPRFAYTIGLKDSLGCELIFAGGIFFMADEIKAILNVVRSSVQSSKNLADSVVQTSMFGSFTLSPVDPSWAKLTTIGVFDYYEDDKVSIYQIIPDSEHMTLDVPDMNSMFNVNKEPIWQWLTREWNYPVPATSTVTTNLLALKGEIITEITRWEKDEWEMFAGSGSEVKHDDARVVSLGTVLGIDPSIEPSIYLKVGKGIWREGNSPWNDWDK